MKSQSTKQMQAWAGKFGREYTDRNVLSLEEMDSLYREYYGISRSELNLRFLQVIDRSARILEVGSNIGNQLLSLQKMGFPRLYGIDLQDYAVELSQKRLEGINIIQASAFNIPFENSMFGLVFTSGLLIHISPRDINRVMDEIYRCSRRYIWGFEYYADEYEEVNYRGHAKLLWKANFTRLYLDRFPALKLIREERVRWLQGENIDTMFLLEKK